MPPAHVIKIEDARTGQWLHHLDPVTDPVERIDMGWTMGDWNQLDVSVETVGLRESGGGGCGCGCSSPSIYLGRCSRFHLDPVTSCLAEVLSILRALNPTRDSAPVLPPFTCSRHQFLSGDSSCSSPPMGSSSPFRSLPSPRFRASELQLPSTPIPSQLLTLFRLVQAPRMGRRATRPAPQDLVRCRPSIFSGTRRPSQTEHREGETHAGGGGEGAREAEGAGVGRAGESGSLGSARRRGGSHAFIASIEVGEVRPTREGVAGLFRA
jgi:hypothetical protein